MWKFRILLIVLTAIIYILENNIYSIGKKNGLSLTLFQKILLNTSLITDIFLCVNISNNRVMVVSFMVVQIVGLLFIKAVNS